MNDCERCKVQDSLGRCIVNPGRQTKDQVPVEKVEIRVKKRELA